MIDVAELADRAASIRRNVVRQAAGKGEGYVGQGLQCADAFAYLFFHELLLDDAAEPHDRDHFLLSVGHYAIGLYAALVEAGRLDAAQLDTYGADGSELTLGAEPGHVPGIEFAGGSLGHGLGVGAGWALGIRMRAGRGRAVVYLSDGELQEGSTWEAAMFAGHHQLANLVAVVDLNRTQADGPLVLEVEPVASKFEAFGWRAVEVDGHDIQAMHAAFDAARDADRPQAVVLHTTIGKGSPTVEARPRNHFMRVKADEWHDVVAEVG